jgi:hypothetical protein
VSELQQQVESLTQERAELEERASLAEQAFEQQEKE